MSTSPSLTQADVERLLADPSADSRTIAAEKVAGNYGAKGFSASEKKIAEEIFRVMAKDTEVRVRTALAQHLKTATDLPRDVAGTLANDVATVALPMIRFSPALTDQDLVEIVQSQGPDRMKAIAERKTVSKPVAEALADRGTEDVVSTLVSNLGADLTERAMQTALDHFGELESVNRPLALRPKLPVVIAERLVHLVAEELRTHLMTHHKLGAELVSEIVLDVREKVTLGLLPQGSSSADVRALVAQLYTEGRLSESIRLRALCVGDMSFFEAGIALLAQVPLTNTRVQIHDEGHQGLVSILKKAGFNKTVHPLVQAAIDVARETVYDGGDHDRPRFIRRTMERILTRFDESKLQQADLDFLLAKLVKIDPVTVRPAF